MNLDNIAKIIIPIIITAPISYWFGIHKAKKEATVKNQYKRYEEAYIPYIKYIYSGYNFNGFSENYMDFETRTAFFDLITKNLHLWGESTIVLYQYFYKAYLDMLEYDQGDIINYPDAPRSFKYALTNITFSILLEAQTISNNLLLPSLVKPLIENYRVELQKLNQ